ncbi:MAG: hypothetical protein ACRDGM_07085, partial [bacterium]
MGAISERRPRRSVRAAALIVLILAAGCATLDVVPPAQFGTLPIADAESTFIYTVPARVVGQRDVFTINVYTEFTQWPG